MAPPKKSRSLNKRSLHTDAPSTEKNSRSSQSCKKRKNKLSDKLGPQWSKEEIERFYEAYRKYGQDWKKVASSVYDRSIEMVEALYNMNRAYLSLPEGTASIVGLIALMTDYYDVMGDSDSERENYDASGFQKLPRTNLGKVQMSVSNEDHLTTHSVAASGGCLSSLRRILYYGNRPRAVGKRTPRIPISYSNERDKWENPASGNKSWQKSEFDVSNDEVAHVAALALTEASQRIGSPSTSMPRKIKENMRSSYEVSGRRKGRLNEEYGNDSRSLVDIERVRTVEAHHKMKKRYRKEKVLAGKNRQSHHSVKHLTENRREASNMDDVCSPSVPERKVDTEHPNVECELLSPLVPRKKSEKLFSGDENTALDALQRLADLSLMMPYTPMESKSSVRTAEKSESFNLEDRSCIPEATLSARSKEKRKQIMVNAISSIEDTSNGKSKPGRGSSIDAVSKKKKRLEHPDTTWKRKRNFVIPDTKVHVDVHLFEHLKAEATSEHIEPINNENQVTLPIKQGSRSRRKMELQKLLTPRKTKSFDDKLEKKPMKYSTSVQDRAFFLKDKLSNCMSSTMVRRWCIFEWFYSAIDYPWFARREFVEYLDHVGLENIPRLTRVEWGVVRSSLGKPRRFSERFLHAERMKLKHYRESVRQHYTELRAGISEGLHTDLARPLSVGQRVIALHPNTREVHDGSVLTVDHDKCRVQFDDPKIGVKLVMDFDCMPSNPMDNLPEALKRQSFSINTLSLECKEPQANRHPNLSRELEKASSSHTIDTTLVPFTMFNLKQHNTFYGNSLPPWLKPPANTSALRSVPCSLNVSQESGCRVVDIVKGSREKAQLMVNVAIEVLSSTKEGDDPFTMIWGALDSSANQKSSYEYQKPLIMSQEHMNDTFGHFNQPRSSEHLCASGSSSPRLRHPNRDYAGIPSDLITSCVATLLMIQACTERPYPPGDVARILGSAVKSLHPRCSQNLHFYKEIETCIGRIKTQLLAIVPT